MQKPSKKDSVLLETVFPIIEDIVTQHYEQSGDFIDRDSIARKLLTFEVAKRKILERLPPKRTREQVLDKAANCVDWLNACITAQSPTSSRWNGDFYSRIRQLPPNKAKEGTRGLVYWLAPHSADAEVPEDLKTIIADRSLTRTEREQLIRSRLGQGTFRKKLEKYWHGRCALTGCSCAKILRASHIKPWRLSTNAERLNPFNGLLLAPALDAAFDACLISFKANGQIMIAPEIKASDLLVVGIRHNMRLALMPKHEEFMQVHRELFLTKRKKYSKAGKTPRASLT